MSELRHNGRSGTPREALDSSLWALSGVERRLGPIEQERSRPKRRVRLGLQGRFTLALVSVVMLIIVLVAVAELQRGIQEIRMVDGQVFVFRNLHTIGEWTAAVLFLIRTPVIALVATGLLLLFYTSRYVVVPLGEVGSVAESIAGGDLTRSFAYRLDDEIGDLVESFNGMTRSLVRKVDQLASLNQAGHAFSHHLSLDELADTVELHICAHIHPSTVALHTVAPEAFEAGTPYSVALKQARTNEDLTDSVAELQRALALRSAQTEQVCLVNDGDQQIRSEEAWMVDRPVYAIGMPLFSEGHAFGAVTAISDRTERTFSRDDVEFLKTLASHVSVAARNAQLYRSLEISYLDTVAALAAAVDAKDAYTRGHSDRVMRNAVHIARAVGLLRPEVEMIRYAALLHDVGKIGLPTHILSTKERLTAEEFDLVKQHPVIGYEIVQPISFLQLALPGIRHHHERWDGKGYPDGLAGEDIPFMARLLTLADTWDAMAHDRFYRRARTSEEIVAEFRECAGSQFDPELVPVAISVLPEVTGESRGDKATRGVDA